MKATRTPAIIFALLYGVFLLFLINSAAHLPEEMASHFNGSGQPDDWMSRKSYLLIIGTLACALPGLFVLFAFMTRFFPVNTINLPQRDYWLSTERRAETFAYIVRHTLWLGCLMICFIATIHYLTLQANRSTPVHFATGPAVKVIGVFVAVFVAWIFALIRHFRRAEAAKSHED